MYGLSDSHRERLGAKNARAPQLLAFELPSAEGTPDRAVHGEHAAAPAVRLAESKRRAAEPLNRGQPAPIAPMPVADASLSKAPGDAEREHSAVSPSQFSDYQRRLYEAVANSSRYPAEARRLNLSGVTRLAFKVDRDGKVLDSWIQESSGSELLDDAALAALDRAQPLPPLPAGLPSQQGFVIEIDLSVIRQDASQAAGRQ
ncbi:TonB family protein [Sphingomonas sp. KR3-1]|uniref:TonB family protein n=1 Tax=Sphingomonas sp. KR3-1 TaxID=3156611 RepID=UPI0032B61DA2